jgi:phosphonatase-like hydrolase
MAAEGVTLTAAEIQAVRGATKRLAIARLLAAASDHAVRVERAYARFQRTLLDAYSPATVREVPGARAVMADLRARGVRVALNTGFDRALTHHLLAALGWHEVADVVVCGDDVAAGRPAPYLIFHAMEATGVAAVHAVANVGDTALDLRAGANAGVRWNIGVWSGAHERTTLAAAPHTHLCPSVADVPALLGVG